MMLTTAPSAHIVFPPVFCTRRCSIRTPTRQLTTVQSAACESRVTHGFDDQGRKLDAEGKLRDWWDAADAKAFEERAAVLGPSIRSMNRFPAQR